MHPSVRLLADLGVVDVDDASARELRVEDLSRSHLVTRVTGPGGTAVVVKTPGPETRRMRRGLASELFVYRLATWLDDVTATVPEPLAIDEGRQVLVLDGRGRVPLVQRILERPDGPQWAAEALGAAMGRWHRATTGLAIAPTVLPLALDLVQERDATVAMLAAPARAVAERLLHTEHTGEALRRLRTAWRPACIVHGDLKWDNCVADPAGDAASGIRVIDWETAGFGDPAWDVGCAIAEQFAFDVALGRAGAEQDAHRQDGVVCRLLSAYAQTARVPAGERGDLADRAATAAPARLAQLALEHADADARAGRPSLSGALAGLAETVARAHDALLDRWRPALG